MSWLRDTLCDDLANLDRKAGRVPDTRLIEQTVDRDIGRWQAEQRERRYQYTPKLDKKPDEQRHDAAKRVAEQNNAELRVDRVVKNDVLPIACPCGGVCRHCKLRQRLLVLLEPLPPAERTPKVEVWKNAKHPRFAKQIIDTWTWQKFSKRAKQLKQRGELDRVVLRKLEDIADRSTSLVGLGPWQ